MIQEIEIKKTSINENSQITINFKTNTLIHIQNNIIKENKIITNTKEIINIIKKSTTYWNNAYKTPSIIDGKTVTIKISTQTETEHYIFKNKFPHNYKDFINELRKLVII